MAVQQGEEFAHGKALPGAAGEGRQGLGERLRLVGQGETDATLTPVDPEQPSRHPCAIVAKNSVLVLVRLSRSSRNSIASTGGISARKLRSRYTLLSSSLFKSSSSLRVLERCTSIAGNVRRSAMRRSRMTSMLPVPLNSSKITSSMREPVSISAVARMVSEPPPSIVRAAESRDRVEQDHDVLAVLHQALGLLDHHVGDLHVAVSRLIERGGHDLDRRALDVLLHV